MEGQIPIIRLKKGYIKFVNALTLDFILGLVYKIKGVYYIELHFDESINLEIFFNENKSILHSKEYELYSKTDEGHNFYASKIWYKSFPFHKSMADFHCNGFIKIEKISNFPKSKNEISEDNLHFVVLEGLKIGHISHSKFADEKFGKNHKHPFKKDGSWDYTEVTFNIEFSNYMFLLYDRNENVILEFQHPEAQYLAMQYMFWKNIKLDFINFLSFLNGAKVIVREEHFGDYYSPETLTGEKAIYYSQETHIPRRWNNFMPIDNAWYRADRIIEEAFLFNFHIYQEKNKLWDLNTIIFYLNSAEQTLSLGDKLFIQTIMLERLSNKFAELSGEEWGNIVPENEFDEVGQELLKVLLRYKQKIEQGRFNTIHNRLNTINKAKRKSNDIKFRNLIEGVGIQVCEKIGELLIKRHTIIHHGEVGEFNDALNDLELMDKLLRTIIIKIIGYKGTTIEDGKDYQNPPERLIKDIEPKNIS